MNSTEQNNNIWLNIISILEMTAKLMVFSGKLRSIPLIVCLGKFHRIT